MSARPATAKSADLPRDLVLLPKMGDKNISLVCHFLLFPLFMLSIDPFHNFRDCPTQLISSEEA
jgi:hypothetical protein